MYYQVYDFDIILIYKKFKWITVLFTQQDVGDNSPTNVREIEKY